MKASDTAGDGGLFSTVTVTVSVTRDMSGPVLRSLDPVTIAETVAVNKSVVTVSGSDADLVVSSRHLAGASSFV